ncbi:NAD(P)H-hydrate epimerase [Agrilactobacillus fermenti]|uniref:NAD(P)H-hydrate epimerase n=1 Tax=Agrilactobacillus fermenti TaxID=2586909 RepID=UPI003A5BF00C
MAACDQYTIETIGIPSLVLMERAALETTRLIEQLLTPTQVLVVCGTGNNGGDGLAIARMLHVHQISVTVVLLGDQTHASAQTKKQLQICDYYQIPFREELPEDLAGYDLIVDAIFGIGLSRPITGAYAQVIQTLNQAQASKVAVDMPSGLNANTGAIMGVAFQADLTITMAYRKVGQLRNKGPVYCGLTVPVDIGIYRNQSI